MTHAPDRSRRMYVAEQAGRIYVMAKPGARKKRLFLNLSRKVRTGADMGILGLAFHPKYAENGVLYIHYSQRNKKDEELPRGVHHYSVLSSFEASPKRRRADVTSEVELLRIPQPHPKRNGGGLAFGPDGYLYVGVGDGGQPGDPRRRAQNIGNLLGAVLRLDVDCDSDKAPYCVPRDNPFAYRRRTRPEIYAWGFRDPRRISFDYETGSLWAADPCPNRIDEINHVERGRNYGWPLFVGSDIYLGGADEDVDYAKPTVDYRHDVGGRGVIGGRVYRGDSFMNLYGVYVYGNGSGRVRGFWRENNDVVWDKDLLYLKKRITSFGAGPAGELYLTVMNGQVYRIVEAKRTPKAKPAEDEEEGGSSLPAMRDLDE